MLKSLPSQPKIALYSYHSCSTVNARFILWSMSMKSINVPGEREGH